jgi:putative membrane protein
MKRTVQVVFCTAVLAAAGACHSTSGDTMSEGSMASSTNMAEAKAMALHAPDIAGVMTVANQGEVQQAQAALPHLTSQQARDFANMMIADHTAALNSARDVFARNNIAARDTNMEAASLKATSDTLVKTLRDTTSSADRTYIQSQINVHQDLLNRLDTKLIPASSGELRTLLQTQRMSVANHLDHARQILTTLP